jgi:hypothetical protein
MRQKFLPKLNDLICNLEDIFTGLITVVGPTAKGDIFTGQVTVVGPTAKGFARQSQLLEGHIKEPMKGRSFQ